MAGDSPEEMALVDALVDYAADINKKLWAIFGDRKWANVKNFLDGDLKGILETLNKLLVQNNNGDGYFVGSGVTYADFVVYASLEVVVKLDETLDFLLPYPALMGHFNRVRSLPRVSEYIRTRRYDNGLKGAMMLKPKKLIYFDFRARAENIRLMFALTGTPYEDVRVEYKDWPELKPKTPNGGLPMLEINGKELGQSKTIGRYVAGQLGLAGKSPVEKAQADAVVDLILEALEEFMVIGLSGKAQELMPGFLSGGLQKNLTYLDGILGRNNRGEGYYVGDGITWADLNVYATLESVELAVKNVDFMKNFPKVLAHYQRIKEIPQITKYVSQRKETLA